MKQPQYPIVRLKLKRGLYTPHREKRRTETDVRTYFVNIVDREADTDFMIPDHAYSQAMFPTEAPPTVAAGVPTSRLLSCCW